MYWRVFTWTMFSCMSLSWLTKEEIFLVSTLTATWEKGIFPQGCRESPLCWAGACDVQQLFLPTISCTPTACSHHLRRGGSVGSAHQCDWGWHTGDLLIKYTCLKELSFFRNEETGPLSGGTEVSSFLPPWKSKTEDTACSYPPQHTSDIFIPLKKMALDHPLTPATHRHSCPQRRRLCLQQVAWSC